MSKVAVVTGGTSGIGKQTALALKAAGYTVYELSRRAQGVEGLHHLVADITREELVDAAIGEVLRQEGHIDVVVNNAASASAAPSSSPRRRMPSGFLTQISSAWST